MYVHHCFVFVSFFSRFHLRAQDLKSVTWKYLSRNSTTVIMMWWSGCDTYQRAASTRRGPSPVTETATRFRNSFLFIFRPYRQAPQCGVAGYVVCFAIIYLFVASFFFVVTARTRYLTDVRADGAISSKFYYTFLRSFPFVIYIRTLYGVRSYWSFVVKVWYWLDVQFPMNSECILNINIQCRWCVLVHCL